MSIGELVLIGIIILLVVPPEKLPGLARDVGRFFNDVRRNTSGVWEELKKDVPNPAEELRKQKLEAEEYLKFIGSPHGPNGPPFETANKSLDQSHLQSLADSSIPKEENADAESPTESIEVTKQAKNDKLTSQPKKTDGGSESL